jgi:hypothetical protein
MTDHDLFDITRLDEPEIHFNEGADVSPKRGLMEHGPDLKNNEHQAINVAAIGDAESIRLLDDMFLDWTTVIHPDLNDDKIRPWRIPFPGLNSKSNLNTSIAFPERWRYRIVSREIQSIQSHNSKMGKFQEFLSLIREQIDWLAADDPRPDVIVVCIPNGIMEELREGEHGDVIVGGKNLHSQIKITGMENSIPTQLIKPETLDTTSPNDRATKAWNLSLGLLYKAQRGHPWKTKKMDHGTCYAGLSFYRDKDGDGNVIRAALAHVFAREDYNIIQSEPLNDITEDENGQPHVSKEGAKNIAEQIVNYYKKRNRGAIPERIVLHKSSSFWDKEREGFLSGAEQVRMHDYVHIRTRGTGVRLFPDGDFPPLRGTLFSVPDEDVHYLYTTGYVPEVATYEGSNIPEPIEIRPDLQSGSDYKTICEEVLFLTKLDWNTSDFAVKEPITLKVPRKVSNVISEEGIDPMEADKQYYYYM